MNLIAPSVKLEHLSERSDKQQNKYKTATTTAKESKALQLKPSELCKGRRFLGALTSLSTEKGQVKLAAE